MTLRRFAALIPITRKLFAIAAGIVFLLIVFAASCRLSPKAGPTAYSHVSTVAGVEGRFGEPFGIAEHNGAVFVSDGEKDCIWRLDPAGPEVFASGLNTPSAVVSDDRGNLIFTDTGSHTIRSVDPTGTVTVIAGLTGGAGSADGPAAAASFHGPVGVALAEGRIYVADTYNDRIRIIENGSVKTLAGSSRGFSDGIGAGAKFDTPTGLAVWHDKLLVADTGNGRIRVIEADGRVWTLTGSGSGDLSDGLLGAAGLPEPMFIAVGAGGAIYFTDGNAVRRIDPIPIPVVRTISSGPRGLRDGAARSARFNRPSGIAAAADGSLLVADSENGLVRRFASDGTGSEIDPEKMVSLRGDPAAFRAAAQPRWPFDPPETRRDIAGTLGEIRGEISDGNDRAWFHNGLDIAGAYGETARLIRDEKVLRPLAVENFGTLRELLRMPTLGYIHIRIGRDQASKPFVDSRFQFDRDQLGELTGIRIARGSKFTAGEPIGTLNAMNHVHLITGRSGFEMNALDALVLPGMTDTRPPTIEMVTMADENWSEFETAGKNPRITLTGRVRLIMRSFDQADGNSGRRRLGLYRAGYQIFPERTTPDDNINWTITFDRLPENEAVRLVYANGSRSGSTGGTIFNYIVTNRASGGQASEGFIDTGTLPNGIYTLRVFAADHSGNTSSRDITFEVLK